MQKLLTVTIFVDTDEFDTVMRGEELKIKLAQATQYAQASKIFIELITFPFTLLEVTAVGAADVLLTLRQKNGAKPQTLAIRRQKKKE